MYKKLERVINKVNEIGTPLEKKLCKIIVAQESYYKVLLNILEEEIEEYKKNENIIKIEKGEIQDICNQNIIIEGKYRIGKKLKAYIMEYPNQYYTNCSMDIDKGTDVVVLTRSTDKIIFATLKEDEVFWVCKKDFRDSITMGDGYNEKTH